MNPQSKNVGTQPINPKDIRLATLSVVDEQKRFDFYFSEMQQIQARGFSQELDMQLGVTLQVDFGRILHETDGSEHSVMLAPYEVAALEKVIRDRKAKNANLTPLDFFRDLVAKKDKTLDEYTCCNAILRPTLTRLRNIFPEAGERRARHSVSNRVCEILKPQIQTDVCWQAMGHGFHKHHKEYRELCAAARSMNLKGIRLPEDIDGKPLGNKFRFLLSSIFSVVRSWDAEILSRPDIQHRDNMDLANKFLLAHRYAVSAKRDGIQVKTSEQGTVIERGTFIGTEVEKGVGINLERGKDAIECSAFCSVHLNQELLQALDSYFLSNQMRAYYRFGTFGSSIDPDITKNNLEIHFYGVEPELIQRFEIANIITQHKRGDVLLPELSNSSISFRPHVEISRGHILKFLEEINEQFGGKGVSSEGTNTSIGKIFIAGISDCFNTLMSGAKGKRSTDIVMSWQDFYMLRKTFNYFDLSLGYDEEKGFKLLQRIQ